MAEATATQTEAVIRRTVVATGRGLRVPGSDRYVLEGSRITALHAEGPELWALVDGTELHRIRGGEAELVATVPAGGSGTCLGGHGGTVWVGGDEARLWRLDGELVEVESFRTAPTHDEWHTPWGGPPAIFSMASHAGDLYVSVHVGGILRTSDGGATWEPTIDLHDDVHQVVAGPDGRLLAATGRKALAVSDDRGASWRYPSSGLPRYALAVAPVEGGALVAVSSGHAARDGALYRFDGAGFERCSTGLPAELDGAIGPRRLAGDGDAAVAVLPGGDVYVSDDAGRTWSLAESGLSGVSEVVLVPPGAAPA